MAGGALTVIGKAVLSYVDTRLELKNVKDKIKKTGKDFVDATKIIFADVPHTEID